MTAGGWLDLAYLRAHPQVVPMMVQHQRIRATPLPGGDTCRVQRFTLDGGETLFAKSIEHAPEGFFAAEAAGLDWLAETATVPVPEVISATPDLLLLEWVSPGPPGVEAARALGTGLANLHACGASGFGAPWPGFIGSLPMDNHESGPGSWPEFYATRRVQPYLRAARDAGSIGADDAAAVTRVLDRLPELAGPDEPPARLHGDLWSGNVLWSAAGPAYLVDPAAHGGHRETDLAMLALFGLPHLDEVLAAYADTTPLADGWPERVALHQLFPVLVHAALFGASYGSRAGELARGYL